MGELVVHSPKHHRERMHEEGLAFRCRNLVARPAACSFEIALRMVFSGELRTTSERYASALYQCHSWDNTAFSSSLRCPRLLVVQSVMTKTL